MIDGVVVKKLKVIADERGWLMEIVRKDDAFFEGFGQTYLTIGYPNVAKAWHYHKLQDDNFCVIKGMAKVGLYDVREGSPTKGEASEYFIGEKNPCVIHIPTGVLHGFMAIGGEPCYLVNLVRTPYNYDQPDEYRVAWNDPSIPFQWVKEIHG